MSLDFDLVLGCDYCGHEKVLYEAPNYTYNVAPMWYALEFDPPAGTQMVKIDGMTGEESLPILLEAVSRMRADPDRFRRLNPANGWGSYEGFLDWLVQLADAAKARPGATWRGCR